jgi:ABC-2 type transport system permease protein
VNLRSVLRILMKDLRLGPRSPIFFFVLLMPVLMTVVIQLVFGNLFAAEPRLGIVDMGSSALTAAALKLDGVKVTVLDDEEELKKRVEGNDLDAGLVLPAGFDEEVRSGEKPTLQFYIGGESLASNRIILSVTALELVRGVEGKPAPVKVTVKSAGDPDAPDISERLVPLLVFYALLIAAVFLTAFSLADEREHRTLYAVLVTPVSLGDVLAAKGTMGFILAILMAVITLALNGSLKGNAVALVIALAVAALMLVEVGLIFGTTAKDAKGLFTLMKSTGILFMAPVFFYLFPGWPQWIAKIFPTYWVIDPVVAVSLRGEALGGIAATLSVALGLCVVLVPVIAFTARRSQAA